MKFILNILLFIILLPYSAEALTYYVAPGGAAGTNCSNMQFPGLPTGSIKSAINCAGINYNSTGNVNRVEIKAGNYNERLSEFDNITWPKGASWSVPATIIAVDGHRTVVVAPQTEDAIQTLSFGPHVTGQMFLVLDGLDLDGEGQKAEGGGAPAEIWGFNGGGVGGGEFMSHVRFQNGTIRRVYGQNVEGSVNHWFFDNMIFGPRCGDTGGDHCFYTHGGPLTISNSEFIGTRGYCVQHYWDASGDGDRPAVGPLIFFNNVCRDGVSPEVGGTGQAPGGAGIVSQASSSLVYNNIFLRMAGNGFQNSARGGYSQTVANGGVTCGGWCNRQEFTGGPIEIYNNLFFDTGNLTSGGIAAGDWNFQAHTTIIRNNLFFNVDRPVKKCIASDFGNCDETVHTLISNTNACWGHNDSTDAGCLVTANPLLADIANDDFRPCIASGNPHPNCGSTQSPLIDAGATLASVPTDRFGTTRPQGDAYDIGPTESGGSKPPPVGPPEPILVAAWSFDNVVSDSSGNLLHGTLQNGASFTSAALGKYNHSLLLDGNNDFFQVLDHPLLDITHGFTIEGWVYLLSTPTGFRTFLVKNYRYYSYISTVGHCGDDFPLGGHAQGLGGAVCYGTAFAINVWTHFSVTWNGTTLRLGVNGVEVANASSSAILDATTGTLQVGASQHGEHLHARVDNIRLYNHARSFTVGSGTCDDPGGSKSEIQCDMDTPILALIPPAAVPKFSIGKTGTKSVGKTATFGVGK